MPPARVVVEDLVKVYEPSPRWMRALVRTNVKRSVRALAGISFIVEPGEICAVVGPNGAGKTTTFKTLVGLVTPTSGRATVMGYDVIEQSVDVRHLVGWMPGDYRSLFGRHSVAQNLRFHGRLQGIRGAELEQQIDEAIELVGLGGRASSTIFALSAGMRARVQLARALLHRPQVLILDEPTGSVDPVASHELIRLIQDVVEERRLAALISSHRLEEIETLHSRVLLMDRGRIRFDGKLDDLRRLWERPMLEIQFRAPEAVAAASASLAGAGLGVEANGDGLLTCELGQGVAHADVLVLLQGQIEDIVQFREIRRPLQAVLADLYASDPDPGEKDAREREARREARRRERGEDRRRVGR
jgi:ABC-2 type transport system ATP-binding protein